MYLESQAEIFHVIQYLHYYRTCVAHWPCSLELD